MKEIASITMGYKVSEETLKKIHKEIDSNAILITDPDVIAQDIEQGLVSLETASKARGYPEGEVESAKKDRADRAAAVALAQSKAVAAVPAANSAARGDKVGSSDPNFQAKGEKEQVQFNKA
jgi:hypothetical protein